MTTIEQLKENTENFKPLQIKGNLRQVNPIKEDASHNKYQIIFIEDGTGDLKVKIKDSKLFMGFAGEVSSVILRATKGPKSVPVGLVYLAEKEMLVVSEGAEIIEDVPIKKEDPKPEPVKKEKSAKKEKPAEVQSTEKIEILPSDVVDKDILHRDANQGFLNYDVQGPSDEVLYEEFLERAHIYQLLLKFNRVHNDVFPFEHLLPMTTSILIDARRSNAKILDHSKKNNQQVTIPQPKITEAQPVTIPSEPKKEKEEEHIPLKTDCLKIQAGSHSDMPWYNAPDYSGNGTIGAVFQDNERRPKMIKWAYSMAKKKLPDPKKAVRDNIFAMVNAFNKYDRVTLIQEAIMHDVADANGFEFNFDKENKFFTRVEAKANEIIASAIGNEAFDPHKASIAYFTGEWDKTLPNK